MPGSLSNNTAEQTLNVQNINIRYQKQIFSNFNIRNSSVYHQIWVLKDTEN